MSLITKKLVTERETASYKLDRSTVELVKFYSEFIGSPQEHVVNEALLFVFRKDKEFNAVAQGQQQASISCRKPNAGQSQRWSPDRGPAGRSRRCTRK